MYWRQNVIQWVHLSTSESKIYLPTNNDLQRVLLKIRSLLSQFTYNFIIDIYPSGLSVYIFSIRYCLLLLCLVKRVSTICFRYDLSMQIGNDICIGRPEFSTMPNEEIESAYEYYRYMTRYRWYYYLRFVRCVYNDVYDCLGFTFDVGTSDFIKFSFVFPDDIPNKASYDLAKEPMRIITFYQGEKCNLQVGKHATPPSKMLRQYESGRDPITICVTQGQLVKGYIAKRRLNTLYRSRKVRQQIEKWRKSLWVPPNGALCVKGFTNVEHALQIDLPVHNQ